MLSFDAAECANSAILRNKSQALAVLGFRDRRNGRTR